MGNPDELTAAIRWVCWKIGIVIGQGKLKRVNRSLQIAGIEFVFLGLQLGGQKYAQFIFFRDQVALEHFRRGNFEFGAQASAVAATKGASADANYDGGVVVFTHAGGGLMFEGSVGGQQFTYERKQ